MISEDLSWRTEILAAGDVSGGMWVGLHKCWMSFERVSSAWKEQKAENEIRNILLLKKLIHDQGNAFFSLIQDSFSEQTI